MYKAMKLSPKYFLGILALTAIIVVVIKALAGGNGQIKIENAKDAEKTLASYGWEVKEPCDEAEIVIPAEFGEIYGEYNELQKKQGFDLYPYRTETVKRYTFEVLNFSSENAVTVYANMLVFGGALIGGDLCSYDINGFMVGLDGKIT